MQLGIPPDALFFCFCHPCIEAGVDLEGLDLSDPFVSLLLCGGFLYLDEMYDVVAVNAFYFNEVDESKKGIKSVINLGAPTSLDDACIKHLQKLERFQPVTVPWLKHLGYTQFAWICPSEVLGEGEYHSVLFPVSGGFAYTYRNEDNPERKSCFVPVVAPEVGVKENAKWKEKPEKLSFRRLSHDSDYIPR